MAIKRSEKSVRFSEYSDLWLIPSRRDITAEELFASSFTDEEYLCIRRRERELADQLSRFGEIVDADEDELGLKSMQQKSQSKQRVRDAWMSVILEQEFQMDAGVPDACAIALHYEPHTRNSAKLACCRGLSNENQVRSQVSDGCFFSKPSIPASEPLVKHRWYEYPTENALVPVHRSRPSYPNPSADIAKSMYPWERWATYFYGGSGAPSTKPRWHYSE